MTRETLVAPDPERVSARSRLAATGGVLPRLAVGLVIALGGMLAVGGWLSASSWLSLPTFTVTRVHWIILTIVGAALVASGYALGTRKWWRPSGIARRGGVPRARPAGARLLIGAVVLGLLGVGSWSGYSGVVGAEEMVNPTVVATLRDGIEYEQHLPGYPTAWAMVATARQAGVPVLLHYCDGATHGAVVDHCPDQWASWVDDFLRPLATR